MRSLRILSVLLLLPVSLSSQAPRTRDSAGVTIVSLPRLSSTTAVFRSAERPSFDIGGVKDKPEDELNSKWIYSVARLSDGRVVVADRNVLKFYSAAGKFVQTVGRDGSGPQEFRGIEAICRIKGDTLVVFDPGNGRMAFISPSGAFNRVVLTNGMTIDHHGGPCIDNQSRYVAFNTRGVTPTGDGVMSALTSVVGFDGKVKAELGMHPMEEMRSLAHWSSSIIGAGDRAYVANPNQSEVKVFTATGKLERILRIDSPKLAITKAEIAKGQGINHAGNTSIRYPTEGFWPAFQDLRVDPLGRLWIEDPDRLNPTSWTVLDATGKVLGRWTPKKGWWIKGIGKDEVIVQYTDDEGAVHIAVFPVMLGK